MSISVIIPAYNAERYLARAIESVLQQTYQPQEIFVVDDGSTDGTAEVARKYADRVKYLYQENAGCAAARNRAIKIATGDAIAFLDADDEYLPCKLQYLADALEKYPQAGMAIGASIRVGGRPIRRIPPVGWVLGEDKLVGIIKDFFGRYEQDFFFDVNTTLVRREVFEKVGPFDETFINAADIEMWSRVAGYTECVYVDHEVSIYYTAVPDSLRRKAQINTRPLFDNEKMRKYIREPLWPSYQRFRCRRALSVATYIIAEGDLNELPHTLSLIEPHLRNKTYWLVKVLSKLPRFLTRAIIRAGKDIRLLWYKIMGR